jgi:solute carrier family 34 (sodium-dependent phosphate cotransporter)
VAAALAGLLLFVAALEVTKRGASGVEPLLRGVGVSGAAGGLGAGWLGACLLLSGSPVAALSLSLLAAGALSTGEAFFMIGGSRLGAAFVVLVVGALADLRAPLRGPGPREVRNAYIGVTALLATAVVYVPALALAWLGFEHGALVALRVEGRALADSAPSLVGSLLAATDVLPRPVVFLAGIALLLGAFRALDRALPDLEAREAPLLPADHVVYRPWFMFGVGLATTAVTLSVSVSLSLLVPLAARGFVRRENVWPYVMGANVTTLVDTLVAGALVGHPEAARMVALLMLSVGALSLVPVFVFPYAFGRALDRATRPACTSLRSLALFVAALLALPLLLIALF